MAIALAWGMFSILPLSLIGFVLPINFLTFAFYYRSMTNAKYLAVSLTLYLVTFLACVVAINVFGNQSVRFLLG